MGNNFKYFGYGFVGSTKDRSEIEINSTKAYKALRAAFVDTITIEVADPSDTKHWELHSLITDLIDGKIKLDGKQPVLVVPTAETLGGNYEDATSTYDFVTMARLHIIILNRDDLSTCTLDGKVKVEDDDLEARDNLRAEFACARMNTRGRKAMPIDAKFRKVFWAWQNYFIDTQDAIDLLGCSRGTLYSLSQEFITSFSFSGVYDREFDEYLLNYADKPVRGITLDDEITNKLIAIHRIVGDNWTESSVSYALVNERVGFSKKFGLTKEYIRLRLNYMYGRAGMAAATKMYSKGEEYVAQLREELKNM